MAKKLFEGNKSAKGQGFDNNPQNGNKKGQPRKTLKIIVTELKDSGVEIPSQDEIQNFGLLLAGCTMDEVKAMAVNKELPSLIRIWAKMLLSKDGNRLIETIIDRKYGKPKITGDFNVKSEVDMTVNDMPLLSDSELMEILKKRTLDASGK